MAFRYYSKAASQGDADAQVAVGDAYRLERELGVEAQDLGQAFHYYSLAASTGNAVGCFNLALMYRHGEDVDGQAEQEEAHGGDEQARRDAKSFKWLERAANKGLALAQHNLGMAFRDGEGCEANDERAFYCAFGREGHATPLHAPSRFHAAGTRLFTQF